MSWKICFYNEGVKNDFGSLHPTLKAKFEAIKDKMLEEGPNIGVPFTKAIGKAFLKYERKVKLE